MTQRVRLEVMVPSINIAFEQWYPNVVPVLGSVHFAGMPPETIITRDRDDWTPQQRAKRC